MSNSVIGALRVMLGMDTSEFENGATRTERTNRRLERDFARMGRDISRVAAGIAAAFSGAFAFAAKAAVDGAIAQESALAQVSAALASMGDASGRTVEQLNALADAQELRSLFDADVILKQVTANLLTFGNIAGEQFDRAQQAALDMATRLGSEPQAAAIQLGKALNDPIKGITALGRAGVQFTEDQKALIATLVRTGDVAGAQGVILAEVEKQFRGAAAAAADANPYRVFQVTLGQISDTLGVALLPALNNLREIVINNLASILEFAQGAVALGVRLAGIVQALTPLIAGFATYRLTLIAASAVQTAYMIATTALGTALAAARAGAISLNVALASNPFGAAALAVGVLTTAFLQMGAAQRQARAETDNLIGSLKALAGARGADFIAKRNEAVVSLLTKQAELARYEKKIEEQVGSARGYAAEALGPKIRALREEIPLLEKGIEQADRAAKDAARAAQSIAVPVANAGAAVAGTERSVRGLGGAAKAQADAFQSLYDRLYPYQAATRKFAEEMALIQASRLSDADKELAIARLENESFRQRTANLGKATVSFDKRPEGPLVDFQKQLEEMNAAFEEGAKKTQIQTVRIAETVQQMAERVSNSLRGLVEGIRKGDFFSIFDGVLNLFTSLGSAGLFGKGVQGFLGSTPAGGLPGFASGGAMQLGGVAGIDRNVLSLNGSPIARVSRGETMEIRNGNRGGGIGALRVTVTMDASTGALGAFVTDAAGRVVAQAAPAIARAGASLASQSLARARENALA